MTARPFDFAVLAAGVIAVSSAAVLIREAQAPALVIAAWRLALASLPLLLFAGARRRHGRPQGSLLRLSSSSVLTALAGVFLALHFAFWVTSVKETSIATSVFLVTMAPLFVAIASGPLLGEKPEATTWLGLAIAAAGITLMVGDDVGAGGDTLRGDLFALLGALFAGGYFLAGRRLQSRGLGWLEYVTFVYATAALLLLALAVAAGEALSGYSTRTYAMFALLALLPQLIGHTALNRSLGVLPAVAVSIAVLGEPVGATLLGALLLGEEPTVLEVAGGALVLAGVYVGLRRAIGAQPRTSEGLIMG
jgi:drug/metabolite transporter (DMT)-like permease